MNKWEPQTMRRVTTPGEGAGRIREKDIKNTTGIEQQNYSKREVKIKCPAKGNLYLQRVRKSRKVSPFQVS
jgi:predicted RNA-binding Zn-ribbon protein involved in translation (DUF1610 family)